MPLSESDKTAAGLMNLGADYSLSGRALEDAKNSGSLHLGYGHPISLLYAHGLELCLKAALLWERPQIDMTKYNHDLIALYDDARKFSALKDALSICEKEVRSRWRNYLRAARDRHAPEWLTEQDDDLARLLGVYDNATIGSELPELREAILWFNERHKSGGSQFRYLKVGLDQAPFIRAFGLNDCVPWRSAEWACNFLQGHFRKNYRRD